MGLTQKGSLHKAWLGKVTEYTDGVKTKLPVKQKKNQSLELSNQKSDPDDNARRDNSKIYSTCST